MALRGRISIHEAPAWVGALGKELRGAAMKGLYSAALRTVQHITASVIPREPQPPVDRGAYRAAWRAKQTSYGALIFNTAPHAAIVEYGARAGNIKIGRAMIDALTGWVQRHGTRRADARGVAWAIATSMKKRGIFNRGKGLRVLEKAEKEIPRFIRDEVRKEIKKATA